MRWDAPIFLVAAPAVALVIAALAWWARARRVDRAGRWSDALALVARRGRAGILPLSAAALLATTALAGPRYGRASVTTETEALDLVIAVDVSRSMRARDTEPDRLERARVEARRLVQDLSGDRIGLVAFAGRSFILSPLTVDGSALLLLLDALDPGMTSAGGSAMARALRQGRELLSVGDQIADRVLVVFTDGEAHDTLPEVLAEAERLREDGIRLVLVAEGEPEGAPIPVGDSAFHRDAMGALVTTRRRDDVLTAVADAAEGVLVPAGLNDQAGAVRDLVIGYKRAPDAVAGGRHDVPRAWIPLLFAVLLLIGHALTRRTAALAGLAVCLATPTLSAQAPVRPAEAHWRRGEFQAAADAWRAEASGGNDTAWYNLGTALLANGDLEPGREALDRAAQSLDPEVRYRALFNLGLLELRAARTDSAGRGERLAAARARYREALLLRPGDPDARWNYELALEPSPPPNPSGGGGQPPPPAEREEGEEPQQPPPPLSAEQARQILQSIAQDERETRRDLQRRSAQARDAQREKDW